MPKLLQINVTANWGSTGRIAEDIGQLAISKGWDSYIAYGRGNPMSKSKSLRIGDDWDMRFHAIQSRLLDNHGLASKKATRKFIEQIKEIKPDIIHLHNIHGYYLNYEILFAYLKDANIPVIWTLHDCWTFTGHCSYFSFIGCDKWKVGCSNCPQMKNYPASYFLDRSKRNFQLKKNCFISVKNLTLVPVSDWLAGLVSQSFLCKYPICRIYNGINLGTFIPRPSLVKQRLGIYSKYMLLGVASMWSQRKGFADHFSLRNSLSDEYVIVLIGLNHKQIQSLPKGIIGIMRTESVSELAEYYSAADIVLNLSYQETFGLTTVEGFACGTPGIVYNCTASPELITSKTGVVVEPGDIGSLVWNIREMILRGKEQYSQSCCERAFGYFNSQDRYQEYLDLYNSVMV